METTEAQPIEGPPLLKEGERVSWWPPLRGGKLIVESKRLNGVACDHENPEHMKYLEKWFGDKDLGKWMDGADSDKTQSAEYLRESFEKDYNDPESQYGDIYIFYTEKSSGKPVGFSALYDWDPDTAAAEMSVMVGEKEFQGLGFGNEIGRAALEVAFKYMKAFSVTTKIVTLNIPSYKFVLHVGFKQCGILHRSHRYQGKLYDQYLMESFPEYMDEKYSSEFKVYPKETD